MARKPKTAPIDPFAQYQPMAVVDRFEPEAVKAWSLAGRLSLAVGLTLKEAEQSRAEIAKAMTDFTKDEVSKASLDAFASQAKDHTISALRLAALVHVTGDPRALNALLDDVGLIAVPKKYEALIMREMADEAIERATRDRQAFDEQWKAKR